MRSIFWDASTVMSGIINVNGSEIAEQVCAFVTANLACCFHSVANEWIEVKGAHAVGGQDVMTGGRYLDSYERRKGAWRVKSHTFVADCNSTHPTPLQSDGFYEALKNWGSFGKNDPVYAHWGA